MHDFKKNKKYTQLHENFMIIVFINNIIQFKTSKHKKVHLEL